MKYKGFRMVEHERMIVFCGLDCTECPAFNATRENDTARLGELAKEWSSPEMSFEPQDLICDGCYGPRLFSWCNQCDIRSCAIEKSLKTCAECDMYPCEKLTKIWKGMGDSGVRQKANLDQLRGS
ncbi:MAG: DUF3795 domain-containing protein [Candidatus Bathyarchaeota archaeon]|nr:MAG: DUF3795 domain-containing protein [Candidatus Bathyarchaeota archaeon]